MNGRRLIPAVQLFAMIFAISCGPRKPVKDHKIHPRDTASWVMVKGKIFDSSQQVNCLNINKVRLGEDLDDAAFVSIVPVDGQGNFEFRVRDSIPSYYIIKQRHRIISLGQRAYLTPGQYTISIKSVWNESLPDNLNEFFKTGGESVSLGLKPTRIDSLDNAFFAKMAGLHFTDPQHARILNQYAAELRLLDGKIDPERDYLRYSKWRELFLQYAVYNVSGRELPRNKRKLDSLLAKYYYPYRFDMAEDSSFRRGLQSFISERAAADLIEISVDRPEEIYTFAKWISSIPDKKYRDYFILNQMRWHVYSLDALKPFIDSLSQTGLAYENQVLLKSLKKKYSNSRRFRFMDHVPDLPLVDIQGRPTTLKKVKTPFKLLSVYDKNCLPCIDDYKEMDTLRNRGEAIPAMIVISRGQDYNQTIEEHKKLGIDWPDIYFVTDNDFFRFFNFLHYPAYYYLNGSDVIIKEDELHFGDQDDPDYFNDHFGPFNTPGFNNSASAPFYLQRETIFKVGR